MTLIQHSKSLSQESPGCQEEDCVIIILFCNIQCTDLFPRTFINYISLILNVHIQCSQTCTSRKIIKIINYLLWWHR